MQFFSFLLLTPSYIKLKQAVSFKPMSSPGCLVGGFGWDGAGVGDGFGVGGSLVDGGDGGRGRGVGDGVGGVCGGRGRGVGVGDGGGRGRLGGVCTPCMVFAGQSRLAEVHC
jgi:hypothetical protein